MTVRLKRLKELVRTAFKGASDEEIAALLCVLDMVFRNRSYRVHVSFMHTHKGMINCYGLESVPLKSNLWNMAKRLADKIELLYALLLLQAGKDAKGTLAGDSSGFSITRYEDWEDAKKGIVSRKLFDKLHVLVSPHGMIVACEVTRGRAHDSPIFRDMFKMVPDGSGHVLLDAAYLAKQNCQIIADSGRTPVICPKENSKPRGFSPMGKMLRWHRDDHEGFDKVYHQRSLVENVFSVMKERYGATARARTSVMRKLQLTLKCICYNLTS